MNKKWMVLFLFFIFIFPQGISAHALLERANPAPDSQLSSSPSDITLVFNERLEKELFYIKVLDSKGHSVTENPTEMSQNQKEIHLSLPALEDDIYTVTYQVLSADGHPIRDSYIIGVGKEPFSGEKGLAGQVQGQNQVWTQILIYGIRILYFLSLLLVSGWIAWGIFHSFDSIELQQNYRVWAGYLQKVYLIVLLVMLGVQVEDLLAGSGWKEVSALLFHTSMGISLMISLLLSILGFLILQRQKWVDALWVIGLMAAKSISGHAMAFEPPIRTILLDLLHLLAASLWIGGLCYLLLFWKKHRESLVRFLPLFSKTALASMIALWITGILSTWIFLPKLSYLVKTSWGILLLIKVGLVGCVVLVGAILRDRIKKNWIDRMHIWLKVDLGLMIWILIIVGVFTYQSPLPPNQPLYWHEMNNSVSMITTQITPNSPGINHFRVDVSLSKPDLQIKNVELFLTYRDNPDVAPIKVPLKAEHASYKTSFGIVETRYTTDGPYLPFAGNWTAELRVMDSEDNETVYTKDFTIY